MIGWIGSPSTWTNVQPLLPLIRELTGRSGAVFRAVGAGPAAQADRFDGMQLVDWAEGSEISEVQNFDIGIMPLRDLPFQRGKSGYKLVQYMACGVPLVASPVGVNVELVAGSNCGLLASDETEWRSAVHRLLDNPGLRRGMGERGRRRAVERYSLVFQATRMVDLFRSVAGKR